MKRHINILLSFLLPLAALAQHVRVAAPRQVEVGEQFQVEYIIYTEDVEGLKLGKMPHGIELLAGPYYTSQRNLQMVNGHMSSSSSESYTYVFMATKRGNFNIPPARIIVKGQTLASTPVKITAAGNANISRSAQSSGGGRQDIAITRPEVKTIGSKDLFVKVTANKRTVHEQEPVLLTYKVYTNVNLVRMAGKMPDIKGSHVQEITLPQQKVFRTEKLNGRTYRTTTWSQYVVYPQATGKLRVPSVTFTGLVRPNIDDFDPFAFMNDGGDIQKQVEAEGIAIDVLPLPQKPTDFSGAVGKLNIKAQLNKTDVKEGDPVNLRIVIAGVGNLKLMRQPTVTFPDGFDVYDPKLSDKTHLTANGVEGSMVYDFLAVPRKEGKYTVPPVTFVYFDTATKSYKTLRTQAFKINVAKGDGTTQNVEAFTGNGKQDIRGLKTGAEQMLAETNFFGSFGYWFVALLLVAVFVVVLIMLRKRANIRGDIARLKGKNAERVALNRLHKAKVFLEMRKAEDFYDENLRALWGYVSDKLNIPVEQLSRNNVKENFAELGIDGSVIDKFIAALDECEFQRYAPGDERGNMSLTYDAAVKAITDIEEAMRNQRTKATDKGNGTTFLLLSALVFALFALSQHASAVTMEEAAKAYNKGNYQEAIKHYQALIKQKPSAPLYYNLGNAYYRNSDVTQAIIAYERALKLAPSDEDTRYNLQLAQAKTIDRLSPESDVFFMRWLHAVVYAMSIDAWGIVSLVVLFFSLAFALMYFLSTTISKRKVGFFAAFGFLLLFVLCVVFAKMQQNEKRNCNQAIIVASIATVKATPDAKGENAITLHEGTKVEIVDSSMDDWKGIRLPDQSTGWIPANQLEEI
ncbi:BatD family protein [Prevotella intermedia]|uniref:Aerotolerance regulator BatD n=1 Tax=Prevotella intermedia TaxID=28131 RepID=A0A2M8TRE8_PREIN|nr:BatD family protein [Prevotella intermedia]PJI26510.1 aerotolerance regulator BatD [Prevotella intermedia]